jgi:hypothetical protein
MSLKEFRHSLSREGIEGELIKAAFISLVTSLVFLVTLYFLVFKDIPNFIPKYGFYLFFAALSYALILPSVIHVRAYREFACMSGMMIGMTIGMISGFLPAFFIGATNGMFWGSVIGMTVGIFFGVWNGRCCGIMGVMEGIMAGFMGSLMGAMTSVMMFNDNLKIISVIIFAVSAVIIIGLDYLIFTETRESERKHKDSKLFIVVLTFILMALTIWIIVFGPRSPLFQ